jgi:hypothetical protein
VKVPSISAATGLRVSAVLTLIGLALMVWSLVQQTPLPVMLAMSLGQGIGMIAFGLFIYVVVREIRREHK